MEEIELEEAEEELELAESEEDEDIKAELEPYNVDIFDDIGVKRAKNGDLLKYEIYKNHQMLTTKTHPYSWEELQRDFGGGYYKVKAKSLTTGKYVKSQSKQVADSPNVGEKNEVNNFNNKFFDMFNQMNKSMLDAQQKQEEKLERERREAERKFMEQQKRMQEEAQSNQNTMLAMITAMMTKPQDSGTKELLLAMQQQSQQNMQMMMAMMQGMGGKKDTSMDMMQLMMQMNQSNALMIEKMNEANARAFEKMSEKFEKLKSNDDLSGLNLINLVQEAQAKGFEQMKMIQEIAEKKAEELAGDDDDKEDESITKTLIKSLAPTLASIASANMQQKGGEQPAPSFQQTARPQVRHQQRPINHQAAREGVNGNQGQRKAQAQRQATQGRGQASGQGTQRNTIGLPLPASTTQQNTPVVEKAEKSVTIVDNQLKDRALDILIPVVVEYMSLGKDVNEAATGSLSILMNNNLNPFEVVPMFTGNELIGIANKYGLHESEFNGLNNWLKGYYDTLLLVSTQSVGQPSTN
jgi:hypothetical protein